MIGYNRERIDQYYHHEEIERWHQHDWIDEDTYTRLSDTLNNRYHEPNIFIRTGYFILTIILINSAFGFAMLVISDVMNELSWGYLSLVSSVLLLAVLQYFVINERQFFRHGVDDAVLYAAIAFAYIGLLLTTSWINGDIAFPLFSVFILGSLGYVYRDRLLSVLAAIAVYGFIFSLIVETNEGWAVLIPFIFMVLSGLGYYMFHRLSKSSDDPAIVEISSLLIWLTLIMLYLSGNYYIVDHLNRELMGTSENPLWWLFYITTFGIPITYLVLGITRKHLAFFTIGLIALPASVISIGYYYNIMPSEWALVLGGLSFITIAIVVSKKIGEQRWGLTTQESASMDIDLLEALIATHVTKTQTAYRSGGGSFGGGGASGSF